MCLKWGQPSPKHAHLAIWSTWSRFSSNSGSTCGVEESDLKVGKYARSRADQSLISGCKTRDRNTEQQAASQRAQQGQSDNNKAKRSAWEVDAACRWPGQDCKAEEEDYVRGRNESGLTRANYPSLATKNGTYRVLKQTATERSSQSHRVNCGP